MKQKDLKKNMIVISTGNYFYKIVTFGEDQTTIARSLKTNGKMSINPKYVRPWVPKKDDIVEYIPNGKKYIVSSEYSDPTTDGIWLAGIEINQTFPVNIDEIEPCIDLAKQETKEETKEEQFTLNTWIQHLDGRQPRKIVHVFDTGVLELNKGRGLIRTLDPKSFENYRLWMPKITDRVIRILDSGRYENPMRVRYIDHEKALYFLDGLNGSFRLNQLEPYIVEDKVHAKEDVENVKGKLKYEVGDDVEVRSLAGGKNPIENLPYFFRIKEIAENNICFYGIANKDFDSKFCMGKKGTQYWFTEEDIVCKVNYKQKPKCDCEGSGFLNAEQIPADIFIEGTEAIVDWMDETNAPFEDSGCSCHCGNPPCSYCTDRTLAEVCVCNAFAINFKGQDPLEGKTLGDVLSDTTLKSAGEQLGEAVKKFGKACSDIKEEITKDPETCMTEGDFIGHEDSLDGHGQWMDDFQEQGRISVMCRRGTCGPWESL